MCVKVLRHSKSKKTMVRFNYYVYVQNAYITMID